MSNVADWEEAAEAEQLRVYGCVRPPWVEFPGEHPGSFWWREGAGEGHKLLWWHWWTKQQKDEAEALAYFRQWPPDDAWLAWVGYAVWPDSEDALNESDSSLVERLEALGIGTHERWRFAFFAKPEWD